MLLMLIIESLNWFGGELAGLGLPSASSKYRTSKGKYHCPRQMCNALNCRLYKKLWQADPVLTTWSQHLLHQPTNQMFLRKVLRELWYWSNSILVELFGCSVPNFRHSIHNHKPQSFSCLAFASNGPCFGHWFQKDHGQLVHRTLHSYQVKDLHPWHTSKYRHKQSNNQHRRAFLYQFRTTWGLAWTHGFSLNGTTAKDRTCPLSSQHLIFDLWYKQLAQNQNTCLITLKLLGSS